MDLWTIFKEASQIYGLPFALFIFVIVYVFFKNDQREKRFMEREDKYVSVIQTLSQDVKERLTKIETKLSI